MTEQKQLYAAAFLLLLIFATYYVCENFVSHVSLPFLCLFVGVWELWKWVYRSVKNKE